LVAICLYFSINSGGKNRFQRFILSPQKVCIHTFYRDFSYFLLFLRKRCVYTRLDFLVMVIERLVSGGGRGGALGGPVGGG
jgi:hypothetical protein